MALRTEEEVLDNIRAAVKLVQEIDDFAEGDFLVALEEAFDETEVGDPVPENTVQQEALNQVAAAMAALKEAALAYCRSVTPSMGRLANSPSLDDNSINADYFQKYAVDNSKEIVSRGFTKTLNVTGVTNGDGTAAILAVDHNGDPLDEGVVETLEIRCTRDQHSGSEPGREQWSIRGRGPTIYPWEEAGSGASNGGFNYTYGRTPADIIPNRIRTGLGVITTVGGDSASGNIINNGNFVAPKAGNTVPSWVVDGDPDDIENADDPINGVNSLRFADDVAIYQLRADGRFTAARTAWGIGLKVRTENGGSGTVTGTLRVRVQNRQGNVTFGTLTVDLSTLTPGANSIRTPALFWMGVTDQQVRIIVDVASLGGTSATPKVTFDDVTLAPARLINGVVLFIYDGTNIDSGRPVGSFADGDLITVATSSTDAGAIQRYMFNLALGRYLTSGATASTDWEDPS
jgi:hypothetical protein